MATEPPVVSAKEALEMQRDLGHPYVCFECVVARMQSSKDWSLQGGSAEPTLRDLHLLRVDKTQPGRT